jgi:hypothetical protein
MAQAFAQDIVNVLNPKYKPRGSEEKDLFTLQLYYVYAIFCSNLKTDFGQKLVWDYESSQNAQAIWKELSNDPKFVMTLEPDFRQLRPRFGWLPIDAIKKTFECTTQLARMPMSTILKK